MRPFRLAFWNINSLDNNIEFLKKFIVELKLDTVILQETMKSDEVEILDFNFSTPAVLPSTATAERRGPGRLSSGMTFSSVSPVINS